MLSKKIHRSLLLATVLVTNIHSIDASGIFETKQLEKTAPLKAPPEPKNLHPYNFDDNKNHSFGLSVSYLGGSYGPTNIPIAIDGVSFSQSPTLPSGSVVNVDLNWSNGIEVNTFYSLNAADGPLVFLDYRYIVGAHQMGGLTHISSPTAPMFSTFPLDISTGETLRVYSANGLYNNAGAQIGAILIGRSLLQKGSTSLFIASGLSGYFINHKLTIDYNINDVFSDSEIYTIHQTEYRLSGGPEIRLIARKSFGNSFGIDATLSSYGHLAYFRNSATERFTTRSNEPIYPYGTFSRMLRAIPAIELTLGSYYTYHTKNSGSVTFTAAWDGGFEPDGTLLTSPSIGSTAYTPNLMAYAILRIGATYSF